MGSRSADSLDFGKMTGLGGKEPGNSDDRPAAAGVASARRMLEALQRFGDRLGVRTFGQQLESDAQLLFGVLHVSFPSVEQPEIFTQDGKLSALSAKLDGFLKLLQGLRPVIVARGAQCEIV